MRTLLPSIVLFGMMMAHAGAAMAQEPPETLPIGPYVVDLRGSMPRLKADPVVAAAINLTRALAGEWGQYNINVNAICPGFFPSKMSAGLLDTIGDAIIARAPLKRIGGDEDLMGTVVFLASEASRHITGQYIAVDGGSSAV